MNKYLPLLFVERPELKKKERKVSITNTYSNLRFVGRDDQSKKKKAR